MGDHSDMAIDSGIDSWSERNYPDDYSRNYSQEEIRNIIDLKLERYLNDR